MTMVKTGNGDEGDCEGLKCPAIWTDREAGVVEVQGDDVSRAAMPAGVPAGESRVRMSLAAFDRAARQHLGITG